MFSGGPHTDILCADRKRSESAIVKSFTIATNKAIACNNPDNLILHNYRGCLACVITLWEPARYIHIN